MKNTLTGTAFHFPAKVATALKYVVLTMFSVTALFPFVWILMSSFKDKYELYGKPFSLPAVWQPGNYLNVWHTTKVGTNLLNSTMISVLSVGLILLLASMAAYVLSRVRPSKGMSLFFTLGIMIPVHAILIPTFILMKQLGLYDKQISLIIIYTVSNLSLGIFILAGFMKTLPAALEDSARIDGCSRARTFFLIIFPLSKPGLATIGTLAFLNCWNEYLFAYVLIANPELKTLTQGIMALKGQYTYDFTSLCAGLIISIVPVVVAYMLFQEQVIKGMIAGAVKG